MKLAALGLVTLGLALGACSKSAPVENSTSNDSLAVSSESLSDNVALPGNAVETNGSNASL